MAKIGDAFQPEQLVFHVESAAVAAQSIAGSDDAVAGDNDRDRIIVVGLAYGPKSSWTAYLARDIGIGTRFAIGDGEQGIPAFFLEFGADKLQLAGELAQLPFKIGLKLLLVRKKPFRRLDPYFVLPALRQLPSIEKKEAQPLVGGRQQEFAGGALHPRIIDNGLAHEKIVSRIRSPDNIRC